MTGVVLLTDVITTSDSGTFDITDTALGGGTPAGVIVIATPDGFVPGAEMAICLYDGTNKPVVWVSSADNASATDAITGHSTDGTMVFWDSDDEFTVSSLITNGVRISIPTAPSRDFAVQVLAFDGVNFACGIHECASSAADESVTGLGFTPTGVLTTSVEALRLSAGGADGDLSFGFGFATGTTEQAGCWTFDDDGDSTTDTRSFVYSPMMGTARGAVNDIRLDLTSFDVGGFTFGKANTTVNGLDYFAWCAWDTIAAHATLIDESDYVGTSADIATGFEPSALLVAAVPANNEGVSVGFDPYAGGFNIATVDFQNETSAYNVIYMEDGVTTSDTGSIASRFANITSDLRFYESDGSAMAYIQASKTATNYTLDWSSFERSGDPTLFLALAFEYIIPPQEIEPTGIENATVIGTPSLDSVVTIDLSGEGFANVNLLGVPTVAIPPPQDINADGFANTSFLTEPGLLSIYTLSVTGFENENLFGGDPSIRFTGWIDPTDPSITWTDVSEPVVTWIDLDDPTI